MKMIATTGITQLTMNDGSVLILNADGSADVPNQYIADAHAAGMISAPDAASDPTTGRPASNLTVGLMWYDTTLSKPIWWSGTQWKDAAGTAV